MAVVGFGSMGESIVLQALKIGHYIDERELRITVLDKQDKKGRFLARYPQIPKISNTKVDFIDTKIDESGTFDTSILNDRNLLGIDIFYICLDNDARSISCGLTINKH